MKKFLGIAALALTLSFMTSCNSGPKRISRSWDDWVNQKYTENSWVHGALLQDVLPIWSIVGLFAALGDALILNPYHFWTEDVWDGKGTGFIHENPVGAERTVSDMFENL